MISIPAETVQFNLIAYLMTLSVAKATLHLNDDEQRN
jgi:hypothetical protein